MLMTRRGVLYQLAIARFECSRRTDSGPPPPHPPPAPHPQQKKEPPPPPRPVPNLLIRSPSSEGRQALRAPVDCLNSDHRACTQALLKTPSQAPRPMTCGLRRARHRVALVENHSSAAPELPSSICGLCRVALHDPASCRAAGLLTGRWSHMRRAS